MKPRIARILSCFDRKTIELEVEEELRFHIELLRREHIQQGMTSAEARVATLRRFGNLEKITTRCLEIRRRNRPLRRMLKVFSILLAFAGFVVRILATDPHVAHVGDTLIAVAISGRLLVYVRGLSPASFAPNKESPRFLFTMFTDRPGLRFPN